MNDNLFNHVNIDKACTFVPDGLEAEANLKGKLREMVREVNKECVAENEILSNELYIYNRKRNEIAMWNNEEKCGTLDLSTMHLLNHAEELGWGNSMTTHAKTINVKIDLLNMMKERKLEGQVKCIVTDNLVTKKYFILGFTAITSVYEIAVTGKRSKSDKVKKFGEQISKRK